MCVFRKVHASRLFKRVLDAEAARANGDRTALKQAYWTAEMATRAFLWHKDSKSLYYYVYKWIVTDFCLKYGFKVRELILQKDALKPWLRKAAAGRQSTSAQM